MEKVNKLLDNSLSIKAFDPPTITTSLTFALWGKMFVGEEKPAFD